MAEVSHKFSAKHKALFLRRVADGTGTLNRLPDLLKEATSKGFKRLLHFPATTMRKEKHSWFSFHRFACLVPKIEIIKEGLHRTGEV